MAFVTDAGLANVIAAWNAYASRPQWLQFGTGSGQATDANDLAAAVQSRVLGATTVTTTTLAGDTLHVTGGITAEADSTISELGLFDAASGGNMDFYGDFAGIALTTGDAIAFAVRITAARAA